jgi:hypothetical protein
VSDLQLKSVYDFNHRLNKMTKLIQLPRDAMNQRLKVRTKPGQFMVPMKRNK